MRTIKFRFWDIERKKYLSDVSFADSRIPSNWQQFYIPQQFTGLLDKSGVEVYEGDILKYDLYHDYGQTGEYKSYREEVRYVTGCAAFTPFHRYTSYEFSHDRMEVIGNIYENPELLPLTTAKDA